MRQEKTVKTFLSVWYDQKGETDECYTVGDVVSARILDANGLLFGKLNGEVTEIFYSQEKNIYQLKLANGWCCHPQEHGGRDEVTITKKYETDPITTLQPNTREE